MKKVNFVPFLLLSVLMFSLPTKFFAEERPSVTAQLEQKYKWVTFVSKDGLEYYRITDHSSNDGIADVNGKIIIPCKYDYISPTGPINDMYEPDYSKTHFWSLKTNDDKYGVADSKGKIIVPCIYNGQVFTDSYHSMREKIDCDLHGFVFVMGDLDCPRAVYSSTGKEIIPISRGYTSIYPQLNHADGMKFFKVEKNGKQGICDANGKEIIPPIYKSVHNMSDWSKIPMHFFSIQTDQGSGIYDYTKRKIILSPKYDQVWTYNNLYSCRAEKKGEIKIYYNDKLVATVDEMIGSWAEVDKYTRFIKNKEHGLINEITGYVIPFRFDSIMEIKEGNVSVMDKGVVHLYSLEALENGKLESMASMSREDAARDIVSDVDRNIPKTKTIDENTFAVIIANENYNNLVVPSAGNDGKIFKEYCLQTLGISKENIMFYEDATINNIYAVINRLKDLAAVYDEGCKVIFYYSGQGITDERTKEMYLLPSDGTMQAISSTCYSISQLYKEIGTLENVEQALFLIDAPFNGMTRENKPLVQARSVAIKSTPNKVVGNAIAVEAAAEGETAHVYVMQNHGLFTYYLLKALQNNSTNKSMIELMPDVIKNVQDKSTRDMKIPQNVQIKYAKH